MRPSIRQVAEHAHVSPMTVSRVLRGRKSQVADETFERVMSSVRDLGYVPVASALQNRHVQTGVIGVVPFTANLSRNPIDAQTFEGLCVEARAHSFDLLVMLRGDEDWMSRASSRFLDRRSDGFIFISPEVQEWQTILRELRSHDVPAVICYRRDVPGGTAWIDPDNERIAGLAVGHLHEHGHRRLAYLSGPQTSVSFDDCARQKAFEQETRALGLDATIIEGATESWELKPDLLAYLTNVGATGVVCVNDFLALQVWDAAQEAGLRIPRDFSLVGVDDQDTAHRGLSSVGFGGYAQVGRLAVESWVALRNGQDAADCCRVLPVHLVERASVGAPPSV